MGIHFGSNPDNLHLQAVSVPGMSLSKEPDVELKQYSWSWWEILNKHSDKAIRACVAVLVVLCICLIVITITMVSRPAKISETRHFPDFQERKLPTPLRESPGGACELSEMTVNCQNTSSIYKDVYNALMTAPLQKGFTLYIENQHFPNYVLANNWQSADKDVRKITISNSYFSNIRNEAFNCVDFTDTYALKLLGLKLHLLTNGVLLGLSKLLFLRITGTVGRIHRCFFQPIQSSLMRLKLSAEVTISGDENVFGISVLPRLTALDLSDNDITGIITRNFFTPVPGVKCVTLSNSKIKAISGDAFDDIAENLEILDLSNNQLTIIDVASIERILRYGKVNTYLLGNAWFCRCQLKSLISLYDKYESRFGDIPYCIGPPNLYGVLFSNVSFSADCTSTTSEEVSHETTSSEEVKHDVAPTTSVLPHTSVTTSIGPSTANEESSQSSFQMRCLSLVNLVDDDEETSDQSDYFHFEPPCHEFEVILLANNSVKVLVHNAEEEINIIWFSEGVENFVYTIEGITLGYSCEGYTNPYLVIDNLSENSTYTFCLVPLGYQSITPFNCLPLHIPITSTDEDVIWISNEDKQFTVAMICVIFGCSIILGGAIAYFGIKSYPDLLEGSRHVLVVKRSDQTCYVSTITEGEYIFNQKSQKKNLNKTDSIKKVPLPRASFDALPEVPSFNKGPSYELPISPTIESTDESEDHYELPAIYNKVHQCDVKCIPNKYATSPISPPPLPKRNSDIALHSANLEFPSPKTHPKMSI